MRFFRHGDSLAIVLPDALRKGSAVTENGDYEFFEAEPGVFILASRQKLQDILRRRVLSPQAAGPAKAAVQLPPEEEVFDAGYAILDSEEQAKLASQRLEKQIKTGLVQGVRGFDKRFYLVSAEFLAKHSKRLLSLLKPKDLPIAELAVAAGLDERACLTLLQVMKEQGDVIEKKRGVYKALG
ncbi:MAG: hypothetical protein V1787_00310 [Candidatus Micrarchaeota archaeon]